MTEPADTPPRDARALGRAEGLAGAALAIALLAFVNLLGAEKGLLALVLGFVALRGAAGGRARTWARIAIGLGALQLVTVALVVLLFREEIGQLLALLAKLG